MAIGLVVAAIVTGAVLLWEMYRIPPHWWRIAAAFPVVAVRPKVWHSKLPHRPCSDEAGMKMFIIFMEGDKK